METTDRRKRVWRVIKTFETEVSFDVEAETEDEARQKALEADIGDDLANKKARVSDESVQSIEEVMPTWHFTVWERTQRGVSVEAPNEDEARRMIRDLYEDGHILLDDHDKTTHGFDLDGIVEGKPDWWYIAPYEGEEDEDDE